MFFGPILSSRSPKERDSLASEGAVPYSFASLYLEDAIVNCYHILWTDGVHRALLHGVRSIVSHDIESLRENRWLVRVKLGCETL